MPECLVCGCAHAPLAAVARDLQRWQCAKPAEPSAVPVSMCATVLAHRLTQPLHCWPHLPGAATGQAQRTHRRGEADSRRGQRRTLGLRCEAQRTDGSSIEQCRATTARSRKAAHLADCGLTRGVHRRLSHCSSARPFHSPLDFSARIASHRISRVLILSSHCSLLARWPRVPRMAA